jgi:hypothetical protein
LIFLLHLREDAQGHFEVKRFLEGVEGQGELTCLLVKETRFLWVTTLFQILTEGHIKFFGKSH